MITLYLNGIQADIEQGTNITIDRQVFNLADIDKRRGDLSYTFDLPFSNRNRQLFENAQELNNQTNTPYTQLAARLLVEGIEVISNGFCRLQESTDVYKCNIYSGATPFIEALSDESIKDLDLSDLNHEWTVTTAINSVDPGGLGYIYPLIECGETQVGGEMRVDRMVPCVYAKEIFDAIITKTGYSYSSNLPEQFEQLAIPASDITNYETDKYNVEAESTGQTITYPSSLPISGAEFDERVIAYAGEITDNGNQWSTNTFTAADPIQADLQATVIISEFNSPVAPTTGDYAVYIYKGDPTANPATWQVVATDLFPFVDIWDAIQNGSEYLAVINISQYEFEEGAQYFIWVDEVQGSLAPGQAPGFVLSDHVIGAGSTIRIDNVTRALFGSELEISALLPDVSQKDFVTTIMRMFCLVWQADPLTKELRFLQFDKLIQQGAVQWQNKANAGRALGYEVSGFAQVNNLRYREDDNVTNEVGDGELLCNNTNLKPSTDLITLPFAASNEVLRYNGRDVAEVLIFDDNAEPTIKPEPRIVIIEEQAYQTAPVYADGNGSQTTSGGTAYVARFVPINFDSLIDTYYNQLASVLQNTKRVQFEARLTAADVANLDFLRPYYVAEYGEVFYLERVRYNTGGFAEVVAVRL